MAIFSLAQSMPESDNQYDGVRYGVDVSFPVHRRVSTNYPWLAHNSDKNVEAPAQYKGMPLQVLGNRQVIYNEHLEGCREFYKKSGDSRQCDVYEYDRILMNLRQPQSMENYTSTGFLKVRAPDQVIQLATEFWEKNQYNQKTEKWPAGNSYVNHWDSPTFMVSIDDKGLRGSGPRLMEQIWKSLQDTVADWVGEDLSPTSMYGIRVYVNGAVLLPHVDRLPLVASAMLNVAQDVDEPWPCEIYDHDGVAHNVTLDPGDMLLFESHSILHARPFPLKGQYYAMLFIHFEPTGHSLRHSPDVDVAVDNVDEQYKQASKDGAGGQSATHKNLPPYIKKESPEEEHWKMRHPEGWVEPTYMAGNKRKPAMAPRAHQAAAEGDTKAVDRILSESRDKREMEIINDRNDKGWQPIHEGAANGHTEVVELLVEHGADINTRTEGGKGATPLHLAEQNFGSFHPLVKYLKSLGGLNVGPEL